MTLSRFSGWLCGIALMGPLAPTSRAAGIPEPSLVMYGVVANAAGVRQTNGTLQVTIARPDGHPPLVLTADLGDLNGQFSYVLLIPCDTEVAGFPVAEDDRLRLLATPTAYDRSAVTFNGTKILYTTPALGTLSVSSTDRGRIDRADFSPGGTSDLDTNGLLKSWEQHYFGHLGVDPNADPDHDGMSNLAEMQAGTNPTSAASRLAFTTVSPTPDGKFHVSWSSVAGKSYRVLRSTELLKGFAPVGGAQTATPPANTYTDAPPGGDGPYFYRVQLVTP